MDAAPAASAREVRDYTPRHLADKVLKSRASMIGEKKRVTVLFADIKGSTRLAEEAGAERWHEILDRFFSILSEGVHRYEGTVNQYTGDGIMALFGAPIAHEDHAQRACFAALAMQADVRRFADDLRLKQGLNLTLRIGLNTGEVIVGRIGDDLRMDYTAQGLTVNLAARMEHICEPGHVYLTRDTANLVEGYFRLRDLGAMDVEGASQPVCVFDLEGEGEMRTRLERQMARMGSRFIGREEEMAALHAALERARAGHGAVAAVVGNAGIGKSRLCHEFLEAAQRSGVSLHRSTGVPYGSALPLFPVQALLRSRLGLPDRCSPAETRRLVAGTFLLQDPAHAAVLPALFEFLGAGESQARAPDQAAESREKMLALLAHWLPRADAVHVLLVEDLHFADPATEEFLARLCRSVAGTRTLLLLNYRPEYISDALLPLIEEQVQVTALTKSQICDLARALLGRHPSLDGVPERIAARADGNPYYAEEAVQALVEEGHVEGTAGNYTVVKPIEQWRIPDSIHALISARIDRLPDEPKTLLQSAAVIGQDFRPSLLASLSALAAEPLEMGLTALEESGFVHQRDGSADVRYRFCHPLVQEVAYQTQLESQRSRLHARLATALESEHSLDSPPGEVSVQIAHHWEAAGEAARAGAWCLHATKWLVAHDVVQAGAHFQRAMENFDRAPDSPDVVRGRIAARAGLIRMAQFVQTSHEVLMEQFNDAMRMAERLGDVASMAELHFAHANEQLHHGDAEAAVRTTTEAVKKAVAAGAGQMVHRFRLGILLIFNSAGYPREGVELVNDAAGTGWMTEPIGAENYLSRGFFGFMLVTVGRLQEGERHLREAIGFAEREDRAASWMNGFLVDLAWTTGNYENAMAEARRAVERAEAFGSPFFRAVAIRALGLAHCLLGTAKEAIPLLEQIQPIVAPGALAHQFESNFLAVLAESYLGAGREAEAEAAAERAIASAQKSRSRAWEIRAWCAWMELPVRESRRARAMEGLNRMHELMESSGVEGQRPRWLLARSRWAADATESAKLWQEAVQAFEKVGASGHAHRLRQSR